MTSEIKQLKDSYYAWVTKEIQFSEVGNTGYIAVNTPFVDSMFDNINIYVRFLDETTIELSDWGYTLFNLSDSGVSLAKNAKTTWRILNQILNDFGVLLDDKNTLLLKAPLNKFPVAKNRLLQAIMRINDIRFLTKNNIKNSFNDILSSFLREHNVLYSTSVEVPTKNAISSHFDFVVPRTGKKELLIKTVARPHDINAAKIFNYDVSVTSPVRDSDFMLLLNDTNHQGVPEEIQTVATEGLSLESVKVVGYVEAEAENVISNV